MFDYWTNDQYNTSRIEVAGSRTAGIYDPKVWDYQGKFDIDGLPASEFPFPVSDGHYMFDILGLTDKAVKCKAENGLTFFVPKASLFNGKKLNIVKFYHAARLNSDRRFNASRGLSK